MSTNFHSDFFKTLDVVHHKVFATAQTNQVTNSFITQVKTVRSSLKNCLFAIHYQGFSSGRWATFLALNLSAKTKMFLNYFDGLAVYPQIILSISF